MDASNLVLLQGTLSRASERRTLPSGDQLVQYEVTTRDADGRADTVPVVWPGAPARSIFEAGVAVVVADSVVVAGSKAAARLVERAARQAALPHGP